jgi:hypothetical protein
LEVPIDEVGSVVSIGGKECRELRHGNSLLACAVAASALAIQLD